MNQENSNKLPTVSGLVFIVTDRNNYYSEPVTVRIFNTKEKAINFCKEIDPNNVYLDWEEFEVE